MKKFSILLVVVTLILASCSDNDDSTDANVSIVGSWEMTSFDGSGSGNTMVQGFPVTFNIAANSINENYQLIFTENPNQLTTQGTFGLTIQITALGQTQSETIDDAQSVLPISDSATSNWSINGNQLILTSNGETTALTIEELTDTNLTLLVDISETIDNNGTMVDIVLTGEINFTR